MSDRKEYIERGALIDRFDYYRECFVTEHDYDLAVTTVDGAAIEDDVVEVVRCVECNRAIRRTVYDVERLYWCNEHAVCVKPNDYCSYGERKDGDNNAAD